MKKILLLLSCVCLTGLAACTTTGTQTPAGRARLEDDKISSALERAALQAEQSGNKAESLAFVERIYKRNPDSPESALRYARALREVEHYNRAVIVLSPFAHGDQADSDVRTEFATLQLAMGNYADAERFARSAIASAPKDFRAHHVLGISLDARGLHKEAEGAFRSSLEHWEGDPIPVMNNLALNLVSQGYLDEAKDILYRAAAAAPGRSEIERNLRIVSRLQGDQFNRVRGAHAQTDSGTGSGAVNPPPRPPRKPGSP